MSMLCPHVLRMQAYNRVRRAAQPVPAPRPEPVLPPTPAYLLPAIAAVQESARAWAAARNAEGPLRASPCFRSARD